MTMETTQKRNQRKHLIGQVASRSGDKTLKVVYYYKRPHPLYKKEVKRRTVVHVHDEANLAEVGDTVEIMATRPLSRTKRWLLLNVLKKAVQLANTQDA